MSVVDVPSALNGIASAHKNAPALVGAAVLLLSTFAPVQPSVQVKQNIDHEHGNHIPIGLFKHVHDYPSHVGSHPNYESAFHSSVNQDVSRERKNKREGGKNLAEHCGSSFWLRVGFGNGVYYNTSLRNCKSVPAKNRKSA